MQNDQQRMASTNNPGTTQPIALIPQLMQLAIHMKHIDEVFLWLTSALVEHWQVSVAQIWSMQAYEQGQRQPEVRAAASLHNQVPQQLHINAPIASIVGRMLVERRGMPSVTTNQVFSSNQALLLAQYGMQNWASHFLSKNILLPPSRGSITIDKTATPLTMVLSIFSSYPLSPELMRAASFLVEQALRIAIMQGLVTTTLPQGPVTPIPPG